MIIHFVYSSSAMGLPNASLASPCLMNQITRICLVRHGETDWNAAHRIQGHTDIPLNEKGIAQATATAQALKTVQFNAVYCSDLQRATETARIVATQLQLAVQFDARLRERHFGAIQGLTWEEAKQRFPQHYDPLRERVPDAPAPEGGESLAIFSMRIISVLEELAARHPGETLLVVCHGGCLDAAYRAASGKPLEAVRDFALGNATLNWIGISSTHWQLENWNDEAHLGETGEEISI